ncbi:hypothetical protein JB92DRAFT_3282073 [Gautieria morchelliformis]|nr:hypothetical protein JB92DRAFT_3282073 [Gautieria morchelliformis]
MKIRTQSQHPVWMDSVELSNRDALPYAGQTALRRKVAQAAAGQLSSGKSCRRPPHKTTNADVCAWTNLSVTQILVEKRAAREAFECIAAGAPRTVEGEARQGRRSIPPHRPPYTSSPPPVPSNPRYPSTCLEGVPRGSHAWHETLCQSLPIFSFCRLQNTHAIPSPIKRFIPTITLLVSVTYEHHTSTPVSDSRAVDSAARE